jgi:Zn-dependent peptidase ImmA (M78 family)
MDKKEAVNLAIKSKVDDGSIDIIRVALGLGIDVYGSEEDEDFNAEITYIPQKNKFEILVNSTHSLNRQRFSIAHELAHFVLHRDRIEKYGSLRRAFNESSPNFDPEIEKQADDFAEELLIPEELLKASFPAIFQQSGDVLLPQIQQIAQMFKVSLVVVAMRLRKLGRNVPYISFSYA